MKGWIAVAALLVIGCDSQEELVMSSPDCSLSGIGWRPLTFDPPISVATWRIKPIGSQVDFNGAIMSRADAVDALVRYKDLRPSSYAIIEFDRSNSCSDVLSLAYTISSRFNCSQNYCFYVAR